MSGIGYFSCSGNANDDFFSFLRFALSLRSLDTPVSLHALVVRLYPLVVSPSARNQSPTPQRLFGSPLLSRGGSRGLRIVVFRVGVDAGSVVGAGPGSG